MTEYRADPGICPACPVKAACTPSPRWRAVHRHVAEGYLDRVRAYHQTQPYQKAIRKRKVWVEPLFAEGKQWHQMRRFRLRQLWRVNIEALLIATGQNLKRLLQRRGWGRRPFPGGMAATMDRFGVVGSVLVLSSCEQTRPLTLVTGQPNRNEPLTSYPLKPRQYTPLFQQARPSLQRHLTIGCSPAGPSNRGGGTLSHTIGRVWSDMPCHP
jgi:hypothetical protein